MVGVCAVCDRLEERCAVLRSFDFYVYKEGAARRAWQAGTKLAPLRSLTNQRSALHLHFGVIQIGRDTTRGPWAWAIALYAGNVAGHLSGKRSVSFGA